MFSLQLKYYHFKLGVFIGTIAVLVLVSLASFWLQFTIFDTNNFTAIATQAVKKESSRRSLGELVAKRVFEKTPTLQTVFSDRLAKHIAGVLDTDMADSSINRLVRESQLLVTSPQRGPISIELTGIKAAITSAQSLAGRTDDSARINAGRIPDEVILINTAELPNIHRQATMFIWAGPLSLMLAAGLIIWWVLRARYRPARLLRFKVALISVALGALFAAMLGLMIEPAFIALGRDVSSQTLLRNIYDAFMSPLYNTAAITGTVSILVIATIGSWQWLARRHVVSPTIKKKSF